MFVDVESELSVYRARESHADSLNIRVDRDVLSHYCGPSVEHTSIQLGGVKGTWIHSSFSKYNILLASSAVDLVSELGTLSF